MSLVSIWKRRVGTPSSSAVVTHWKILKYRATCADYFYEVDVAFSQKFGALDYACTIMATYHRPAKLEFLEYEELAYGNSRKLCPTCAVLYAGYTPWLNV